MNTRRYIHTSLLRSVVILIFSTLLLSRCASMMTPEGGPVDSLPPVIVTMLPDNFTTNRPTVNHERIYVEFNEFVQIKDQQKEFFTSPAMKKKPTISLRGRGIVVQLRDTLDSNTTYALNFGSAIRDNNEGNPLNAMRYVFSTGSEIDSMVMSGYTADSYKADSVSKSFIWFFPKDSIEHVEAYDSTIFKYKPAVIARAENNGIFIAQNLKPIPYRVYAIEDTNDNQLYEPGVDQVGFLSGDYNPLELPDFAIWYDSIREYPTAEPQTYFRMFTDKSFRRQLLADTERPEQHRAMLYFGAAHPKIKSIRFDSIPDDGFIVDPQTIGHDTIALWFNMAPELLPDTIKGEIVYLKHDSINQLQEETKELKLSWRKVESKEEEKERKRLEREKRKAEEDGIAWEEPEKKNPFTHNISTSGTVNPELDINVTFKYPLVKVDSAAILMTLRHEDELIEDIAVRMVPDTADLLKWKIVGDWKGLGEYTLSIPEGALRDVAGQQNDSIVGKYTLLDPEDYATVKLNIVGKSEDARYIVQLLDGSAKLLQERREVGTETIIFNYVPAGEIMLRAIEDTNNNGEWDSGDVLKRLQPERSEMFFNDEGEDTFATKENWEVELTINMFDMFAPMTMQTLTRTLDERELQRLQREAEKEAENRNNNQNRGQSNTQNSNFQSAGSMFRTF